MADDLHIRPAAQALPLAAAFGQRGARWTASVRVTFGSRQSTWAGQRSAVRLERRRPGAHVQRRDFQQALLGRTWRLTGPSRRPYPAGIDHGVSFEAARERFRALLVDAVRLRMRSDVAVGTTLSSGMDSPSIVCPLRTFHGREHQALTARFADSEEDESVYAGVSWPVVKDAQQERGDASDCGEALSNHLPRSHERGLATLLHGEDAISMAHLTESRLPFLVEFVFGLPGEYKLRDGRGKALLRESVRGDVPDAILRDRSQLGFVVPIRDWSRSQPDETVLPVLPSARCRERVLIDPKAPERALRRHISGRVDLSNQIFRGRTPGLRRRDALDGA